MSLLLAAVFEGLRAAIGNETLIYANQNSPRPPVPYWTVQFVSARQVGRPTYSQGVDSSGVLGASGVYDQTVRLQRIGPESAYFVSLLVTLQLTRVSLLEAWRVRSIALFDIGAVQSVPFKLDNSQIEDRAIVDLFFRSSLGFGDVVEPIERVEMAAEYVTNQTLGFDEPNEDLSETVTVVL